MHQEGIIQTACIESLAIYCHGRGLHFNQYPPYANQQGESMNAFCADLIGVLDNSVLLQIEFKELVKGLLLEFNEEQHQSLLEMEEKGLPVAYCYNNCWPLPNEEKKRPEWPYETLDALNRSIPSKLPGKRPLVHSHGTLLEWLQSLGDQGEDAFGKFGKMLRKTVQPSLLKNWFLFLVYHPKTYSLGALDEKQLKDIYDWLAKPQKSPSLAQIRFKIEKLQRETGIFPPPPSTSLNFLVSSNEDNDEGGDSPTPSSGM